MPFQTHDDDSSTENIAIQNNVFRSVASDNGGSDLAIGDMVPVEIMVLKIHAALNTHINDNTVFNVMLTF